MSVTYQMDDYVPRGSSLRGYIHVTFGALVEAFGVPNIQSSDKVFNEWGIEFRVPIDDGGMGDVDDYDTVNATIYDWKESSDAARYVESYDWHIGGFHNGDAVDAVQKCLDSA